MAVLLEFRDGEQPVADHVAALLRNVDCSTMTKEEAIRASENQMLRDHLNKIQRVTLARHFQELNRR
jgi:hypothetical protein